MIHRMQLESADVLAGLAAASIPAAKLAIHMVRWLRRPQIGIAAASKTKEIGKKQRLSRKKREKIL